MKNVVTQLKNRWINISLNTHCVTLHNDIFDFLFASLWDLGVWNIEMFGRGGSSDAWWKMLNHFLQIVLLLSDSRAVDSTVSTSLHCSQTHIHRYRPTHALKYTHPVQNKKKDRKETEMTRLWCYSRWHVKVIRLKTCRGLRTAD